MTADYLDPPLQGFRLRGDAYAPVAPDDRGRLRAESVGLAFELDDAGLIVVTEMSSGRALLRIEEEHERMVRAEAARERAEAARERAETELREARAELERVKAGR